MAEGVDGLLRDKTRKPGKAPLPAETVQLVIDLVTAASGRSHALDRPDARCLPPTSGSTGAAPGSA